ncbi:hypothetical protein ACFSE1_16540 [Rhizobium helianthi]|uniref:Uncharacterized protein n=1 Tax=Rhizobium helianthi TaxID=1132695 RepID=A0ABW4M778_9HYPH
MTIITSDFGHETEGNRRIGSTAHPLRAVMITVFAAKLAVAAVLIGFAAFAPTVSAETSYFVSR